jgi:hypothetical protein
MLTLGGKLRFHFLFGGDPSTLEFLEGSVYLERPSPLPVNQKGKDGLENALSVFLYLELFQMFRCLTVACREWNGLSGGSKPFLAVTSHLFYIGRFLVMHGPRPITIILMILSGFGNLNLKVVRDGQWVREC